MAPEIIAADEGGAPYGSEVDLFSLGAILFSLLGAYGAFDPHCNRSDSEVMDKITKGAWSFDDVSADCSHRPSPAVVASPPRRTIATDPDPARLCAPMWRCAA